MLRPCDAARAQLFEGWLVDIETDFRDRAIPIDGQVADRWGRLAATALVHDRTRNSRDIAATGVRLLDRFAGS